MSSFEPISRIDKATYYNSSTNSTSKSNSFSYDGRSCQQTTGQKYSDATSSKIWNGKSGTNSNEHLKKSDDTIDLRALIHKEPNSSGDINDLRVSQAAHPQIRDQKERIHHPGQSARTVACKDLSWRPSQGSSGSFCSVDLKVFQAAPPKIHNRSDSIKKRKRDEIEEGEIEEGEIEEGEIEEGEIDEGEDRGR